MLCLEWGARDAAGTVGLEGSREPHPGSVLQHRHTASSQLPCAGWAGAAGGKESHGSIPALGKHGLSSAAGSYCCRSKVGSKKGAPLTDNRRLKKEIHSENCPLLKPCRFSPNSEKYPNLHLSSSRGPGRISPGIHQPSQPLWPGITLDPALHAWVDFQPHKEPWRSFVHQGGTPVTTHSIPAYPGRAVTPGRAAEEPSSLSSLPSLPRQCCTIRLLTVQSLFQLWANVKKAEKSPGELFHPSLFMEQRYSQP